MIRVTKEEARKLRELYPDHKVVRTMVQRSKRHIYYATEREDMMRSIAKTNDAAAAIVARLDRERELRRKRAAWQAGV